MVTQSEGRQRLSLASGMPDTTSDLADLHLTAEFRALGVFAARGPDARRIV